MRKSLMVEKRTLDEADYMINHRTTIRDTAKAFCMSKSAVEKDLHMRLPNLSVEKSIELSSLIAENIEARAVRGGIAVHNKFR